MSIFFESEAVWSTDMETTSSGKGCQLEIPRHLGYSDSPMHFCLCSQGADMGSTWWSVQILRCKSKRCLVQLLMLAQTLNNLYHFPSKTPTSSFSCQYFAICSSWGFLRLSSEFEFKCKTGEVANVSTFFLLQKFFSSQWFDSSQGFHSWSWTFKVACPEGVALIPDASLFWGKQHLLPNDKGSSERNSRKSHSFSAPESSNSSTWPVSGTFWYECE